MNSTLFKSRRGFSLVEVMVGMFIFGLMSLALTRSLVQALQFSDRVISKSIAHTIAVSYSEQLMATSYDEIYTIYLAGDPLVLKSVSLDNPDDFVVDDDFEFGEATEKSIVMDIDANNVPTVRMPMRFRFSINDLNASADPVEALEIRLDYSFLPIGARGTDESNWVHDSVHFVKSGVPIH